MKFSVLMSVYKNDEVSFFFEALKSVTVDQYYKPAQIVIVQDGPVDKKIDEVIQLLQEDVETVEFTVIRKIKNEGLAAALNCGINACKYEWIARMDSDDVSTPDRFQKQVDFILQNPLIDVVGGAIAEFETKIGDIHSERHVGLTQSEIITMAKRRTPMNHVTVFLKKSAILEAGLYSENFGKLEDYKLWVDMLLAGKKFANINDVIVHVRIGNGFIERRSNKCEIYDWDMLQKYLLSNNFINPLTALINKLFIRVFIYTSPSLKKMMYKLFLRK